MDREERKKIGRRKGRKEGEKERTKEGKKEEGNKERRERRNVNMFFMLINKCSLPPTLPPPNYKFAKGARKNGKFFDIKERKKEGEKGRRERKEEGGKERRKERKKGGKKGKKKSLWTNLMKQSDWGIGRPFFSGFCR